MTLHIVPWQDSYLADAAALAESRFRTLSVGVPQLPARYCDPATLLPLIAEVVARGPAVVALADGRFVGYLAAWLTPQFRGQRSVYSPEYANGAEAGDSARIYQAMYAEMAATWTADRYFDHYLTVPAHDHAAIAGWHWLGFGDVVMDALRDLGAPQATGSPLAIRRAEPADGPAAVALHAGLLAHLAGPPIFLVDAAESQPEEQLGWMADPRNALWLAWRDGEAVASLGIGPANSNACTVIRDPGTASVMSAFTRPDARGHDVATALLDRALAWARAEGYVRCSVDFETANIPASHFWLRHFAPICHSLGRRVNPYLISSGS